MTTAIVGTGATGAVIVRQLAPGRQNPAALERSRGRRVTIAEPGLAGSYAVVERWADGSLLRPEQEPPSTVLHETDRTVFRDEEFIHTSSELLPPTTTSPMTAPADNRSRGLVSRNPRELLRAIGIVRPAGELR